MARGRASFLTLVLSCGVARTAGYQTSGRSRYWGSVAGEKWTNVLHARRAAPSSSDADELPVVQIKLAHRVIQGA